MRLLLFISFLFLAFTSSSQEYAIWQSQGSIFYKDIQYPLNAFVNGYCIQSIELKSSKGTIQKNTNYFTYVPHNSGEDTVTIFVKNGKSRFKKGAVYFNIRPRPEPHASIGGQNGGQIGKGAFAAQQGVAAHTMTTWYGHEEPISVQSFDLTIVRDNKVIFHSTNEGNRFQLNVLSTFKTLSDNDQIIVSSIKAKTVDSSIIDLKPIEFLIR